MPNLRVPRLKDLNENNVILYQRFPQDAYEYFNWIVNGGWEKEDLSEGEFVDPLILAGKSVLSYVRNDFAKASDFKKICFIEYLGNIKSNETWDELTSIINQPGIDDTTKQYVYRALINIDHDKAIAFLRNMNVAENLIENAALDEVMNRSVEMIIKDQKSRKRK